MTLLEEIQAKCPQSLIDAQEHGQIAAIVSEGRTRLVPTEIGAGTILATLGSGGGAFLDMLVAVGQQDRNVFWTTDLVKQGRLRIDLAATRAGLQALAIAVPSLADDVTALLTLGYAPAPVSVQDVITALQGA